MKQIDTRPNCDAYVTTLCPNKKSTFVSRITNKKDHNKENPGLNSAETG